MDATKMKTVYTVTERNGKSFWLKLGIGFVNSDGSINLKLDGYPANGTLQIRDYEQRDDRREPGSGLTPRRTPTQEPLVS
jgi:hypothetical protein